MYVKDMHILMIVEIMAGRDADEISYLRFEKKLFESRSFIKRVELNKSK